jgi:serine/threonine-protein kinase
VAGDNGGELPGRVTLLDIVETLVGRYRLLERIGSGGMSVVWRGYDEVLGRQVAVKVLAAQFAADADLRSRLRREARAVARLAHPHITNVYDYGEAGDGTPFLVMELVEGESLADRLRRGPLPWGGVAEIGAQIAEALAAAHARGLVHQDVKPANVMLSPTGVKVVDFGIAAIAGERRGPMIVGTPDYMAPEQRSGAPATPATDVYALGLVLSKALGDGQRVPPRLAELIADCTRDHPGRRPGAESVAARLSTLRAAATTAVPTGRARPAAPTRVVPAVPVRGRGTRVLPVPPPPQRPRRPSRWPFFASVTVLLVIACVIGLALTNDRRSGASADGTAAGRAPAAPNAPRPSPTPKVACRVDYKLSDYKIGWSAQVTVTNTGTNDIKGWHLAFDLPDKQDFKGGLGGVWSQEGNRLTVRDWVLNSTIKAGASVDVSLVGTAKGKVDSPKSFTLNDVGCATGSD